MTNYNIKNIVFDIGNVILQWDPQVAIRKVFPESDYNLLARNIFYSEIWHELNRGKITEKQALILYNDSLGIPLAKLEQLMIEGKLSLKPVAGSLDLIKNVYSKGYNLHLLTDNTKEIVQYLTENFDFLQYFNGMVSSADIGYLKPSPIIYQSLLHTYELIPQETVFIDDLQINVAGAKSVGIHAIQFSNTENCIIDLKNLGINI